MWSEGGVKGEEGEEGEEGELGVALRETILALIDRTLRITRPFLYIGDESGDGILAYLNRYWGTGSFLEN